MHKRTAKEKLRRKKAEEKNFFSSCSIKEKLF